MRNLEIRGCQRVWVNPISFENEVSAQVYAQNLVSDKFKFSKQKRALRVNAARRPTDPHSKMEANSRSPVRDTWTARLP